MKLSFASLILAVLAYQQIFAKSACPDFSGIYQSGEGVFNTSRMKQNDCDSLEFFIALGPEEHKLFELKMDGRPYFDQGRGDLTISKWIWRTLSFVVYEDVHRYGYSRFTENRVEIEGNTLKWSYRQFRDGQLVNHKTSYGKRIQ